MGRIQQCGYCVVIWLLSIATITQVLFYIYSPIKHQDLFLEKASGKASVVRDADVGTVHIKADSIDMMLYTQGYSHAQDRLWSMERLRRFGKATLSEMLGPETLEIDKLSLTVGISKACNQTMEEMSESQRHILQAYADGVNDFILSEHTILPPEYYIFGFTKQTVDEWKPVDTCVTMRSMGLFLAWNWPQDLLRDIIGNLENENGEVGDLYEMAEEIVPMTAEFAHNMQTILNDDDLKKEGLYNDKTLIDRYHEGKKKFPRPGPNLDLNQPFNTDKIQKKLVNPIPGLEGAIGSNCWVIHGNHTKSGKPILSSDPHLKNAMPSYWHMQTLKYPFDGEEVSLMGASMPGVPFMLIGRTNYIQWGATASHTDVTDLYREKFSPDETKYLVDGQWKDLKVENYKIKVLGKQDYSFDLKSTHRGPVMDSDIIMKTQDLFIGKNPLTEKYGQFSFVWSAQIPGEQLLEYQLHMFKSKNLFEMKESVQKDIKKWESQGLNLLFADIEGNIAFHGLSGSPVRNNSYPHLGSRILDGTKSDHDWLDIVDFKDLPFVINPEKGYISNSNNRIVPENSKHDIGAGVTNSIRNLRIDELIDQKIANGEKFSVEMMPQMQIDSVDVAARLVAPIVGKIGQSYQEQNGFDKDITETLKHLSKFDGSMEKDSVSATVYATWQHFFYRGLLWKYTRGSRSSVQNPKTSIWTVESSMNLLDHDCSADLYQRIMFAIRDNDHSVLDRYDSMLCGGDPYNDLDQADSAHLKRFDGKNCEYNVIRSLQETNKWLVNTYGSNPQNWKWGNVHLNDYENVPWSLTPLKYIFHRSVPFAGNSFTINVGRYPISMVETLGYFKSMFSANYKQVLQYGDTRDKDHVVMSVDTGQNGNMFAGHYFDLNDAHNKGKLNPVSQDFDYYLNDKNNEIIHISPKPKQGKDKNEKSSDL